MIAATLDGCVVPVDTDQLVVVCVEGPDGFATGCDAVVPTEADFTLDVQWYGPGTRQARMHALQLQRGSGAYPVSYQGYASQTTFVTNSVRLSWTWTRVPGPAMRPSSSSLT